MNCRSQIFGPIPFRPQLNCSPVCLCGHCPRPRRTRRPVLSWTAARCRRWRPGIRECTAALRRRCWQCQRCCSSGLRLASVVSRRNRVPAGHAAPRILGWVPAPQAPRPSAPPKDLAPGRQRGPSVAPSPTRPTSSGAAECSKAMASGEDVRAGPSQQASALRCTKGPFQGRAKRDPVGRSLGPCGASVPAGSQVPIIPLLACPLAVA